MERIDGPVPTTAPRTDGGPIRRLMRDGRNRSIQNLQYPSLSNTFTIPKCSFFNDGKLGEVKKNPPVLLLQVCMVPSRFSSLFFQLQVMVSLYL